MHLWDNSRQDRLNRGDVTQIAWLLGNFLAMLSLTSVVLIEGIGNWIPLFSLLIATTVFVFPKIPGAIPDWFSKFTNVLLVIFLILDFISSEFVQALINLNVLLILVRSLSYRSTREDMQLIVLCMFVIVMMGVLSVSIFFAINIVVFSCCAMALLFIINLRDTGMSIAPNMQSFNGFSWVVFFGLIYRKLDLRHLAFGGLLIALLISIAGGIFVAFPRFGMGKALPFMKLQHEETFAGFSENISFGEVTDIKADHRVAMRIDIPELGSLPAAPYWRMLVLDHYVDGKLSVSKDVYSQLMQKNRASRFAYRPRYITDHFPSLGNRKWTFYLEGGVSRYLPTTGIFKELSFQQEQSFVFNPLGHILNIDEVSSGVLFYQVSGMSFDKKIPDYIFGNTQGSITRKMLDEPGLFESSEYPATTLAVPVNSDEQAYLESVVKTIAKYYPVEDPEGFAIGASLWLEQEHNYSLSLRVQKSDGDPVVDWMKTKAPGHCEYFSGALILICRTAGIPARVVTGFHGGSWNGYEDYFMVKNTDAHAWVEVFDGDKYWVRVDPTPGGTQEIISMNEALMNVPEFSEKGFKAYIDSLKILWYRKIVNFDVESQVELVDGASETLTEMFNGITTGFDNFIKDLKTILSDPFAKRQLVLFSILFVLFLIIYLIGRFVLFRLRARSYFKYFGTKKRKKIAQLRERVIAGKYLRIFAQLPTDSNLKKQDFEDSRNALRMIRFGPVESWPSTKIAIKKAKVLLKTV